LTTQSRSGQAPADAVDPRKLEEMQFHDQRERDRHLLSEAEYAKKYSNRKWYAVTERSKEFIDGWMRANAPGRVVLDYCCGLGGTSLDLARHGANVYGIDISPESIETARATLDREGLGVRARFEVMDAEAMTFEDDKFDAIVCFGVLHHLDVRKAFPELSRVLKPGGQILAAEALGYNPAIAAYRRLTPHLRTSWEADHILTMKEIAIAKGSFRTVETRFFHLFAIFATPFRRLRFFPGLLALLNVLDDWILRIPGIRLMAWQMIFVLRDPIKRARHP
jgi:2-polyprenyl-3-methyl-5-hydroxy-6-metoxy-1,4-benzoquinol methylase